MKLPIDQIICGDSLKEMPKFPDNSFDAIVTDIPYGIGFMGKEWDTFKRENVNKPRKYRAVYKTDYKKGVPVKRKKPEIQTRDSGARRAGTYDLSRNAEYQEWCRQWSAEALRIAKPGAFLLCFGGTRTYHRVTCGIEDAGWIIRDCMNWLYGSGFPKSLNISKAIDKAKGVEREQIKTTMGPTGNKYAKGLGDDRPWMRKAATIGYHEHDSGIPATDLAKVWDGYGTALKPAWEPIIVAMKPLDGTFVKNAEKWGVAGLNIEGARIGTEIRQNAQKDTTAWHGNKWSAKPQKNSGEVKEVQGRWPANLILDGTIDEEWTRYFYSPKASRSEKNEGLEGSISRQMDTSRKPENPGRNNPRNRGAREDINFHPTVKPLDLMIYLCKLLKPPKEKPILLDPFCGSGTTLIAAFETGWNWVGIEKEPEYVGIATKRFQSYKKRYGLFENPHK